MQKIVIRDFDIKINKQSVLRALGCSEGGSVYDTVSSYFDELEKPLLGTLSPCAAASFEGERVYCMLTAGDAVTQLSKNFFDSGEGMKGILADAMADDYLFAMDTALSERIRQECALTGKGVKKRLDAPKDFPLSEQGIILEKIGIEGIGMTDAFMLEPVKSFGYILELTDDKKVFKAQHDCSKCANFNCPRRSIANGNFAVLSGYEYVPSLKSGESAVCIDIGTTTVAFELITEAGTVKTYKTINPQRRFGLDVLSRIEASCRGRGEELAAMMHYTLLHGYNEVTRGFGDADRIVAAGNTTMVHLLMNYSCAPLGVYPFKSEHLAPVELTFDKVINSDTSQIDVLIFGGISAFVGGDIVSGLYMCDFDTSEGVNAFIDLGTNGEMAIGNSEKIFAASTAAGPAFEGGRISCGVGSVDGAICGLDLDTDTLRTIGDKPPVGLCGTGIIELCSELIDKGIIDRTGLLSDDYFVGGFKVAEDIVFTQSDIRQVQMAKAAVRAGIETLAKAYGVSLADIDTVYLAGGFGYGLSMEKACNMGILPPEFAGKIKVLGNSSLGGCAKLCSQSDGMERMEHIQAISSEISLAQSDEFQRAYIEYMNF